MRLRSAALAILFASVGFAGNCLHAQISAAQITYGFENPQLQPASYIILIREDGTGHFHSTPGPVGPPSADDPWSGIAPEPVDRDIRIDEPLRAQLFEYIRAHKFLSRPCEHSSGRLAFTGKKTLSYAGSDGQGSCTFNYASDPALQRLSDQLISLAFTLEEGRRLAVEHKHSRLSLDSELETLLQAAKDQRAICIGNISAELQSIADDEEVMQRARSRARSLLASASGQPPVK